MVGAVVMFTVIAPEGKVDLDPTPLTSQTMGRPGIGEYSLLLTFNVGTPVWLGINVAKMCNVR